MADKNTPATKPAFIITEFKDTNYLDGGSERRFPAGGVEQIAEGPLANYAAAGLVRAPTDAEKKAAAAS